MTEQEQTRLVSANGSEQEIRFDQNIRPTRLSDYVGQSAVREQLSVFIQAAKNRGEALDHLLIFGSPGLGKTTLANIVAHEMGVSFKQTTGPILEKVGDLAAILTNLQENDVLFIDEIHRLNSTIEEFLYSAMEDFQIDIMIGEGPSARSIKLELPPFTLVGATTRAGLLTSPLRDRFGIVQRLSFYSEQELLKIIQRSSGILDIQAVPEGIYEIAKRSRGTPRIANRLLRRIRDYAQVKADSIITQAVACQALDLLDIDKQGFDRLDRQLLRTLIKTFKGGPVGIDSLSATLGEMRDTLEDMVEPFLIQQEYLIRTARGRTATPKAYQYVEAIEALENL